MKSHRVGPILGLVGTLFVAGMAAFGCSRDHSTPTAPAGAAQPARLHAALATAITAQNDASLNLLSLPGVVGTGASLDASGNPEVLVLLAYAGVLGIPSSVGGVPVATLVTGEPRPWALDGTYRPLPIGVSVGNVNQCIPGTVACVLLRGNRRFLLSANHVFARQNLAALGEAISQPSPPDLDPNCSAVPASSYVANLSDFQAVVYDGKTENAMDAAIAELSLPPGQVTCATPPAFYGAPSSTVAPPQMHLPLMMVARTTELTRGEVKSVNVNVKIKFPSGTALFVGQLLTSPGFGEFGDSGGLVVTDDGTLRPVGMVIGGTNNGTAIATPIGPILDRFGATICGN